MDCSKWTVLGHRDWNAENGRFTAKNGLHNIWTAEDGTEWIAKILWTMRAFAVPGTSKTEAVIAPWTAMSLISKLEAARCAITGWLFGQHLSFPSKHFKCRRPNVVADIWQMLFCSHWGQGTRDTAANEF